MLLPTTAYLRLLSRPNTFTLQMTRPVWWMGACQ